MTWLLLGTAIASEVAASLSLKGSASTPALYAVVVVGYVSSFVLLAQVLKRGMALGVAYGVWGAAGVAATAIAAALIFDEALTAMMGVGLALIVAGVIMIQSGSRTTELPDAHTPDVATHRVSEH
ncbi:QacE family quaternary ammonium compound efflux SMR transporter [Gordonia sp. TBRC 11910]|uniref:QacE family quaternary ammonium compound efflux SMR transporter n=1 Tax=Gordonia asplenii TaxID=2725283 RepID=A0A848KU50_9ACTN|nr:SMR family transporter [Gordonia asplenii]NMO01802.1 QacE family quaternary ammonium compound efflux SMR transporter [Gordonia asplenii]